MNTDKKNDTNRRMPDSVLMAVGYFGIAALLCASVFMLYRQDKADRAKYIVKDKAGQKISYAPIENQSDVHVMEFGPFDTDSLLYKNLNVGDTIFGRKSALDETVVAASHRHTGPYIGHLGAFSGTRDYDIYRVNAKTLFDIKQEEIQAAKQARRDSIMREMKTKQR